MLVSTDVCDLTEEKKSILMNKEVLAIHSDPLFISGERIRKDSQGEQVWTRPLSNGDYAAVLYNSNNKTSTHISMTWSDVGWSNTDSVLVHDLWLQRDLGTFTNGISYEIPINDVLFVRLSKK
jgi:hypothetical protein